MFRLFCQLADLLSDVEPEARIGAARAVAYSKNPLGVALLRLRVKVGDRPAVLGKCIAALLQLSATGTLPPAETFLEAARKESAPREAVETAEGVALALGESRLPEALPLLKRWWQRTTHRELRKTGLLAIAMLRQEEALQFLLQRLAEAPVSEAKDDLEALTLYQDDGFLWPQVQTVLEQRNDLGAGKSVN